MKFVLMLILTFAAAAMGMSTIRSLEWPYWSYHVLVIAVGVILYPVSAFLTFGFIQRRAPEFASTEKVVPGIQMWELTAGTGIVPKWVSFIGVVSIAFFLACPFELVARLLRTLQSGTLRYVTGYGLLPAIAVAVAGIICQIIYATRLNAFLGGADPVATYGARSLSELKSAVAIPASIQFMEFFAKSCGWGVVALALIWFQSPAKLAPQDESNLENFARAYQEKRLATRIFNDALGSGTGVVTLPTNTVDDLIERYEKAIQLSKSTRPEVLDRVHPELNQIVRGHFELALQLSAEALRTGNPTTSLEAQRHDNAFGDWWNAHRKDMPLLKRVMKRIEGEYDQ